MKTTPRIVIEPISHAEQRYSTLGDYWIDPDGTIQLRVSAMRRPESEGCVIVHELVELLACLYAGISFKAIDRFDMRWKARKGIDEPGEDPRAPYFVPHQHAMAIERHFAALIGLPWAEHEANCDYAERIGRAVKKLRRAGARHA